MIPMTINNLIENHVMTDDRGIGLVVVETKDLLASMKVQPCLILLDLVGCDVSLAL